MFGLSYPRRTKSPPGQVTRKKTGQVTGLKAPQMSDAACCFLLYSKQKRKELRQWNLASLKSFAIWKNG
jgi:hypothetical protein